MKTINSHFWASRVDGTIDPTFCRPELLHQIFERTAEAFPKNVAIEDADRVFTYEQVDRAANQLANYLATQGVRPGTFAAILLERGANVYIAQLAILKCGAAYVPIDPDYPEARISAIIQDSAAVVVVASTIAMGPFNELKCPLILLDKLAERIAEQSTSRPDIVTATTSWREACYVIFTSGSTGRPKGVLIEHRNACNLVRVSAEIYRPVPTDRVLQGFSVAFDAAVEEVWLAFGSGAALVVGSRELMRSGPSLGIELTSRRISILSCVPTLLAAMEDDIRSLRLLILGGEACPPDLIARWWRPGLRILNTYGPTEATVIATWAECHPQKPVTIGKPLPNYGALILNEGGQPLGVGEPGELHLLGAGIARGYVGRQDLTDARFIPNPFAHEEGFDRLYKTGDLTAWDEDGNIRFLGRVDDQIKFRGYRIELTEIETVLRTMEGVSNGVVALIEHAPGVEQLAAYITTRPDRCPDLQAIKEALRIKLPTFMVPATIDVIDEIPTLASGKADRKRLPKPVITRDDAAMFLMSPTEAVIAECWSRAFQSPTMSPVANFFLDLGGHSLLAAIVVSDMRRSGGFDDVAVSDVYAAPTVRQLAARLEERQKHGGVGANQVPQKQSRKLSWSYGVAGIVQALLLFVMAGIAAAEISLPVRLLELALKNPGTSSLLPICGLFITSLLLFPFNILLAIVSKWTVIGRFKPGKYPLWSSYYLRWWFVRRMQGFAAVGFLTGTPLYALYLRAMGADVAVDAHIDTSFIYNYDLITIGNGASIGFDAHVMGSIVENGFLVLDRTTVGQDAYVGHNANLAPGSAVETRASLDDQSFLPAGFRVPEGQWWSGSPAKRDDERSKQHDVVYRSPAIRYVQYSVVALCLLTVIDIAMLAVSVPSVALLYWTFENYGVWASCAIAPVSALIWAIAFPLMLAVLSRASGRSPAGRYPALSRYALRRWFQDRLVQLSLQLNQALYATIYLPSWLRLMGAKIGKHAEVSTAAHLVPDMLEIGEGCFVADAASVGAVSVRRGVIEVRRTVIGSKTFIGNSALVPAGQEIPEGCLIGCMSVPPLADEEIVENRSWLGSPAMVLPRRQESRQFPAERTYKPTAWLYFQRGTIELSRVVLPPTFMFAGLALWFAVLRQLIDHASPVAWLIGAPLAGLAISLATVLVVAAAKWIVIGRYVPGEHPLWSNFVWRTELITALYENVAVPALIGNLTGTPFILPLLRLFGTKIGRCVFMDSVHISEFDLVKVADMADINVNATLQTHLFEDRVMKLDNLVVGTGCSLGETSVVLYGSSMEAGSSLGSLSLLMKGESLPQNTSWHGIPAQRAIVRPVAPTIDTDSVTASVVQRQTARTDAASVVEVLLANSATLLE